MASTFACLFLANRKERATISQKAFAEEIL
jgi:hypothetical protein